MIPFGRKGSLSLITLHLCISELVSLMPNLISLKQHNILCGKQIKKDVRNVFRGWQIKIDVRNVFRGKQIKIDVRDVFRGTQIKIDVRNVFRRWPDSISIASIVYRFRISDFKFRFSMIPYIHTQRVIRPSETPVDALGAV